MEATPNKDAQMEVPGKGLKEAHSSTQEALAQNYGPSQQTLDDIWRWIVKTFAFVLCTAPLGLLVVIALDGFTVEKMERPGLPRFDYYLDESDPDVAACVARTECWSPPSVREASPRRG